MKFKNKRTGEIVETKGYVQEFAYSHNSTYEIYKETPKKKKEGKKNEV